MPHVVMVAHSEAPGAPRCATRAVDLVTSFASADVAASAPVYKDLPVVSYAADGVVWRRAPATNE